MPRRRLRHIDVLKGILILAVVLHHAPLALWGGYEHDGLSLTPVNNVITAFFMPAFFVVTGFCSSFREGFPEFLRKNLRTIMLPCFCLYYIDRYIWNLDALLFGDPASWLTLSHWLAPGLRTFVSEGGHYWFLSAMFLSRLAAWPVVKLTPPRKVFRQARPDAAAGTGGSRGVPGRHSA